MGKCVVCCKETRDLLGRMCLDCFLEVGGEICCMCGKKVESMEKEYWDIGLTKRHGIMDSFHGLLCNECASRMVLCKVCRCYVPPEATVDYVEFGTGKKTGEKVCCDCYEDEFYGECAICKGLIPKDMGNFKWNKKGKMICSICAEKIEKS